MNAPSKPESTEETRPSESGAAGHLDPDRSGTWASWVAVVLLVVPTLAFRFPPMTDLPLHEALVGLMRHFGDPMFVPPDLYMWNLGHPNQMFHLSAFVFSYIFGVPLATKIVVAAAQAGTILGARRFADHLGVTRWTSLLAVPLAIGWTYHWGLIANILGFAVLLGGIPTIDRYAQAPTPRSALRCIGLFVLLYFAHGSVLVIGAGLLTLFVCGQTSKTSPLRDFALGMLPVLVAGLGLYIQHVAQARLMDVDENGVDQVVIRPVLDNLAYLPSIFSGNNDPIFVPVLFVLGLLTFLVFVVESVRTREVLVDRSVRALVFRFRYEIATASLFLAYLFFPDGFAGGTFFNQRFLHPAWAIGAIAIGPKLLRGPATRLQCLLCGALAVSFALAVLEDQVDADLECKALDSLIDRIEPGSAIAYVGADPSLRKRSWYATAMAAHAMARKGGRMMFALTTSVIAPVRMNEKYKWLNARQREADDTRNFMPQHDFRMFRYLLVRAENPSIGALTTFALKETGTLVASSGDWALYESKLPLIGLLDPEIPMPSPTPETLRTRTLGIIQQNVRGFDAATRSFVPAGSASVAAPDSSDASPR